MSLAILKSRALAGVHAPTVDVEVHLAGGLPSFHIVGLADTEVKEAKDRVRAAILHARFEFPARRITVNLAPADLPKESGRFDLPIALGILAASGQLPSRDLDLHEYAGELSLSGRLRPVHGALAMAVALSREPVVRPPSATVAAPRSHRMQRSHGDGPIDAPAITTASTGASSMHEHPQRRRLVLPDASAREAALAEGVDVLPATDLLAVCAHLEGRVPIEPVAPAATSTSTEEPDLADVKGQMQAKRAVEIIAAGGHSLLMLGPPGTGKSMLAKRIRALLPPMPMDEALEAAAIASLLGPVDLARWKQRPFRAPHHTASAAALVGGGGIPRPGEISLAHHGILFLDELPEFQRHALEVLREPLESGHITIARAARTSAFPARFQLVAAMNPCPCGYLGHRAHPCRCSREAIARYRARISGPLLDRIDVQVDVPSLTADEIANSPIGETSATVAARTHAARTRQLVRQGRSNASLEGLAIDEQCAPDAAGAALLARAMRRWSWSARAYHRVLKIARTIADLDVEERVLARHVAEAIGYRRVLDAPAAVAEAPVRGRA